MVEHYCHRTSRSRLLASPRFCLSHTGDAPRLRASTTNAPATPPFGACSDGLFGPCSDACSLWVWCMFLPLPKYNILCQLMHHHVNMKRNNIISLRGGEREKICIFSPRLRAAGGGVCVSGCRIWHGWLYGGREWVLLGQGYSDVIRSCSFQTHKDTTPHHVRRGVGAGGRGIFASRTACAAQIQHA